MASTFKIQILMFAKKCCLLGGVMAAVFLAWSTYLYFANPDFLMDSTILVICPITIFSNRCSLVCKITVFERNVPFFEFLYYILS